jgi:shikimate dehydrogenase
MAERHRAAVLGSPIAHSLSPALHRAAYRSLDLAWTYDAFEVNEADLPDFLGRLDASWAGLSLTMPLKEAVIALLADVDPTALLLRSVNTVLPTSTGWRGTNTDVYGMTEALRCAGLTGTPHSAVVLGAGATARSAVAALARLGVSAVTICGRRPERASQVAALGAELGLTCSTRALDPDASVLAADLVVSTLPGEAASPWAGLAASSAGALLDSAYDPWPTPLAAAWQSPVVASGRDMLLWQAVEQVRLMTGLDPSVDAMRAALPA